MEALTAVMPQNKIEKILDERGISIYKLAKDTGLTYQAVHSLVKAKEIPGRTTYTTLKKVADYLGLTIDELEAED